MIPLYILGLLLRYGSQHGYQIKKLLEEQLEDFTHIKLPTVYYHLEKMEADGLIKARQIHQEARPEKTVYHISEAGRARFQDLLDSALNMQFRPTFDSDAAFFFFEHLNSNRLICSLSHYAQHLKESLEHIKLHQNETLAAMPKQLRLPSNIIFEHHIRHFQAEVQWAEQTIMLLEQSTDLEKEKSKDENESH